MIRAALRRMLARLRAPRLGPGNWVDMDPDAWAIATRPARRTR